MPYLRVAGMALGTVRVFPDPKQSPNQFRLSESILFAPPESTGGTMFKKQSLPNCAGIALVLLFLTNTSARADLIWGYNWEPGTGKVFANGGGSGYLKLTDEPAKSATGSSNTVVTNIQAVSTAPYNTPDIFNKAPVSFSLQLQD